jgi:hypothetical protein
MQTQPHPRRSRLMTFYWSGAAGLMLLPVIATQLTDEMNWSLGDFVLFGAMLGSVGLGLDFLARRSTDNGYRAGAAVALGSAFLLFWVTAAVGIIGSEDEPANLAYLAVLAAMVIGAGLTRFRAAGMARTLFVVAGAQTLIGVAAIIAGLGKVDPLWPLDIAGASGFFTLLWLLAGFLFRTAAEGERAGHDSHLDDAAA